MTTTAICPDPCRCSTCSVTVPGANCFGCGHIVSAPAPDHLRPLPPLNNNYRIPRPWVCAERAAHVCGDVIGSIGASPVCANGYNIEVSARRVDRVRIAALMDTPEMRREAAREQALERRFS